MATSWTASSIGSWLAPHWATLWFTEPDCSTLSNLLVDIFFWFKPTSHLSLRNICSTSRYSNSSSRCPNYHPLLSQRNLSKTHNSKAKKEPTFSFTIQIKPIKALKTSTSVYMSFQGQIWEDSCNVGLARGDWLVRAGKFWMMMKMGKMEEERVEKMRNRDTLWSNNSYTSLAHSEAQKQKNIISSNPTRSWWY